MEETTLVQKNNEILKKRKLDLLFKQLSGWPKKFSRINVCYISIQSRNTCIYNENVIFNDLKVISIKYQSPNIEMTLAFNGKTTCQRLNNLSNIFNDRYRNPLKRPARESTEEFFTLTFHLPFTVQSSHKQRARTKSHCR